MLKTFSDIFFNGKTIPHFTIKNKIKYFQKGEDTIIFPYHLAEEPDYYVSGETLYIKKHAQVVDDVLILDSLFNFKVVGDTLVITN